MSLENKTVRELQDLALDTTPAAKTKHPRLSRAARLELIDLLSRWSAPGLALIGGASVYLAVSTGSVYPIRAIAWTIMVLAALWACRSIRGAFRAGSGLSARPFRWRASYTACLSVLGVAFASAPLLLTPASAPNVMFLQTAGLTLLIASCAAVLNAAHLSSAITLVAPAALLVTLAGARNGDIALTIGGGAAGIVCVSIVIAISSIITAKSRRRHPRTKFLRREISRWNQMAETGAAPSFDARSTKNAV